MTIHADPATALGDLMLSESQDDVGRDVRDAPVTKRMLTARWIGECRLTDGVELVHILLRVRMLNSDESFQVETGKAL